MFESVFGKEKDQFFMQQALVQAHKAAVADEVPVGAVVVNTEGVVVSQAYNSVEHDCTQRSHAESLAIEYATKEVGDWRLDGYWVYVTLEPCSMCIAFIRLSRLAGVVYGTSSPLFGFQLDKSHDLWVYKRDTFSIVEGVMADESSAVLKSFFKKKRKVSE